MQNPLRRFALSICIFAVAAIIVLLFLNYAREGEFKTAAAWHRANGDTFLIDGHKLILPQDWWVKSGDEGEKPFAVKASRDLTHKAQSALTIDEKGVEESKRSEEEVHQILESFVEKNKQQGGDRLKPSLVVVRAVSRNMYCLKSLLVERELELRCNVVGTPIVIKSIGPPETEQEIESILSTFD